MAASLLDPAGLLGAIDWQTRAEMLKLAAEFYRQTGRGLKVRSARRSCAEQAELYGIGRTYNLSSPPVTYAQGCQSWHVLGRAVDADPVHLATGQLETTCELATIAGLIWEGQGGVWGGRFGGFGACGDQGHFEWHPGLSLTALCPDPQACPQVAERAIQTKAPGSALLWALGGALVILGGAMAVRNLPAARRAWAAF